MYVITVLILESLRENYYKLDYLHHVSFKGQILLERSCTSCHLACNLYCQIKTASPCCVICHYYYFHYCCEVYFLKVWLILTPRLTLELYKEKYFTAETIIVCTLVIYLGSGFLSRKDCCNSLNKLYVTQV